MLFPLTSDDFAATLRSDEVVRTDSAVAAGVVGYPDAVVFLSEVGVPWCGGAFQMCASLAAASTPDEPDLVIEEGNLPMVIQSSVGELGLLGMLQYVLVYVRRTDGVVFATSENTSEEYEQINSDVSSLAKLLWLVDQKSPDPRLSAIESDPLYERAAEEILAEMQAVDPAPFADPRGYWTGFLDSFATGMYPKAER